MPNQRRRWYERLTSVIGSGRVKELLAERRGLRTSAGRVDGRDDYLRWLGVRKVERPTYERYIVENPLPAVDSTRMSFAQLIKDEREAVERRWPARPRSPGDMDADARIVYELGASLRLVTAKLNELKNEYGPVSEFKLPVEDRAGMSFIVKKFGMMLGAAYVGIARVKPNIHVSASEKEHYEGAIVIAEPQPTAWPRVAARPGNSSHFSNATSQYGYSRMAFTVQALTTFIRGLGYNAYGHGTSGIFLVPMAIDAGVGEAGRVARVVAPDYGATFRLAALTTDLPLEHDGPISFNLHDFCSRCGVCADVCPAGVRPRGPPSPPLSSFNRPGMRFWYDGVGCYAYWSHGGNEWTSCYRCHAFCPWSEPRTWLHDLARWAAINAGEEGIDLLVSMTRARLGEFDLSKVLWDPQLPSHPAGRRIF